MGKRTTEVEAECRSSTTDATLVSLVEQITGFVSAGTLDSRFASKLVKRLRKEAVIVEKGKSSMSSGRKTVSEAIDTLDAALRDHEAKLLVAANAALRAAETS